MGSTNGIICTTPYKEGATMLVLSRKVGESIYIGDVIKITLIRLGPGTARIGIDAPRNMNIAREELILTFDELAEIEQQPVPEPEPVVQEREPEPEPAPYVPKPMASETGAGLLRR